MTGLSWLPLSAQAALNVSTLVELREAVQKSDQTIVMKPGRYKLTDLPDGSRSIPCSGSNNTIDLSGVYVNVPVGATRRSYITISGNNNTFKGGIFEDTYPSGLKEITDFSSYNQNPPYVKIHPSLGDTQGTNPCHQARSATAQF